MLYSIGYMLCVPINHPAVSSRVLLGRKLPKQAYQVHLNMNTLDLNCYDALWSGSLPRKCPDKYSTFLILRTSFDSSDPAIQIIGMHAIGVSPAYDIMLMMGIAARIKILFIYIYIYMKLCQGLVLNRSAMLY